MLIVHGSGDGWIGGDGGGCGGGEGGGDPLAPFVPAPGLRWSSVSGTNSGRSSMSEESAEPDGIGWVGTPLSPWPLASDVVGSTTPAASFTPEERDVRRTTPTTTALASTAPARMIHRLPPTPESSHARGTRSRRATQNGNNLLLVGQAPRRPSQWPRGRLVCAAHDLTGDVWASLSAGSRSWVLWRSPRRF